MLELENVSVRFGGVTAVDDVSFTVPVGAVTGLLGPNGAGKTTLFNVASGLQRPGSGRVLLDGRDITKTTPGRRARLGMARTFQRLQTFGSLSVLENVLVAAELHAAGCKKNTVAVARDALARVGLGGMAHVGADILPTGSARLLELARALVCRPSVLLLDEPSSGLDRDESATLGDLLVTLAEGGMAVLLVEHDMPLAMRVCARLHVLDFGRYKAGGTPGEIRRHPEVVRAYLGSRAETRSRALEPVTPS